MNKTTASSMVADDFARLSNSYYRDCDFVIQNTGAEDLVTGLINENLQANMMDKTPNFERCPPKRVTDSDTTCTTSTSCDSDNMHNTTTTTRSDGSCCSKMRSFASGFLFLPNTRDSVSSEDRREPCIQEEAAHQETHAKERPPSFVLSGTILVKDDKRKENGLGKFFFTVKNTMLALCNVMSV